MTYLQSFTIYDKSGNASQATFFKHDEQLADVFKLSLRIGNQRYQCLDDHCPYFSSETAHTFITFIQDQIGA